MKKLFPLLLLIVTLASCQKAPDWGKLSNDLLVYTHYEQAFDLAQNNTF